MNKTKLEEVLLENVLLYFTDLKSIKTFTLINKKCMNVKNRLKTIPYCLFNSFSEINYKMTFPKQLL